MRSSRLWINIKIKWLRWSLIIRGISRSRGFLGLYSRIRASIFIPWLILSDLIAFVRTHSFMGIRMSNWLIIYMFHKIEEILNLARSYQLPLWQYSPLKEFDPYFLASVGFKPTSRNLLSCHICSSTVQITEQMRVNPDQLIEAIKNHQEDCLYHNQQPIRISNQDLYLSMQQIINQMDISKTYSCYPLISRVTLTSFIKQNLYLYKKVLSLYDIDCVDFKITFLLKMLGWGLTKIDQIQHLHCYYCGRMIPFSKLKCVGDDKQGEQSEGFDAVGQHRYFCLMNKAWVVYLQHHEDKYAEITSFKYRTPPLQSLGMRRNIDKYLITIQEKVEAGLSRLRELTVQAGRFCQNLGQDKNLGIAPEEVEGEVRKFKEQEKSLEEMGRRMEGELGQPLKKIKIG